MGEDQARVRTGTSLDRKASVADTAALGYSAGVGVATVHYFIKCYATGTFHFVPPEDALIEMWLFLILPTVHLICKIINKRLQKLAGDE